MSDSVVHLHAPRATAKQCGTQTCLDCKRKSRMLAFFTPWYGWDLTCLNCGRRWADGERMNLAFVPKSRQKSIEAAKAKWRRMPPVSKNHYGLNEYIGCDDD